MAKVIQLTKKETYEQALLAHFALLTDEQRQAAVHTLLIVGHTDQGLVYTSLAGDNVPEAIGVLECAKSAIIADCI